MEAPPATADAAHHAVGPAPATTAEPHEPTPLQHSQVRAASARVPKTPRFRSKAPTIDVSVADGVSASAMASPLALFSTRKLPTNSHQSHPVVEMVNDSESLPQVFGSPYLEYGMIVSIVCDERNSIICAEGYASREVRLERLRNPFVRSMQESTDSPSTAHDNAPKLGLGGRDERRLLEEGGIRMMNSSYRDCLFEIVPRMTYDATSALEEVTGASRQEPKRRVSKAHEDTLSKQLMQHALSDLKFKSDAEQRLNAMMCRKLKGAHVVYGQVVQFRHVKTGQFLCLDSSPLPVRGTEYSPVYLGQGSTRAHFSLLPRFKLRSKGAPVQLTDQLVLCAGGGDDQTTSLCAVPRQSPNGSDFALVGSRSHSSQWRAILFDKVSSSWDSSVVHEQYTAIRAGACVRLLHLESNSWLQFGPRRSQDAKTVSLLFCDDPTNALNEDKDSYISSDSLWLVEKAVVFEGGYVKWKDRICLRHLLSGKYLAVDVLSGLTALNAHTSGARTVSGTAIAVDAPHVFTFMPTAVTNKEDMIDSETVVLLQHQQTKLFIHSPETHSSTLADIRISSKAFVDNGAHETVFSVAALPGARDEDAFKIVVAPQDEVDDTLLLIAYKHVLARFIEVFESFGQNVRFNNSPVFDREDLLCTILQVEHAVDDLVKFCESGLKRSQRVHRLRQSMFRKHGFIDLVMKMLRAPFDRFGGPFSVDLVSSYNPTFRRVSRNIEDPHSDLVDDDADVMQNNNSTRPIADSVTYSKSQRRVRRGPRLGILNNRLKEISQVFPSGAAKLDIHEEAMMTINRVIVAVNGLLVHMFCGNRENEVYMVRSAMPTLMELLGNGFKTSLPLSFLLRENRNLVESITAYESIIRNFFELIRTRGRSMRYMQFLVALCTSKGYGVPKMQEAICELLFNPLNGYREFVIVPIRAHGDSFEVLVQSRQVSKSSESETWVGLTTLYQDYYVRNKYRALSQYCYGLLQLYVALCLDRNYVSIDYVQQTFPRDNLLKAVKDATLARSVRAVLLDLIRVAYVDCEPQRVVQYPAYTRIWTEVGNKAEDTLIPGFSSEGYSAADLRFFDHINGFCLSYLVVLKGRIDVDVIPENQLLLATLKVCKKLVEFGMFTTHSKLSALVTSLLNLLDERTDIWCDNIGLTAKPSTGSNPDQGQHTKLESCQTHLTRREDSVTDGVHTLFTTLLQALPADKTIGSHDDEDDLPLLLRLRNTVLLDNVPSSSVASTPQRDRSIARQYGMGSLIWNEHCSNVHRSLAATMPVPVDVSCKPTKLNKPRHVPQQHLQQKVSASEATDSAQRRCLDSPGVQLVMEIKDEVCATLKLIDDIRLEYQISSFLDAFRSRFGDPRVADDTWHGGNGVFDHEDCDDLDSSPDANLVTSNGRDSPVSTNLFGEKTSPLARFMFGSRSIECKFSLSQLAKRNVNTVLMQMLMYEYPPLVSKALELLLQQFSLHDQLLASLNNLQLLVAEDTIVMYNRLKDYVNDLRRLSETTEVWMDLTSKSDFENAQWACDLLQILRGAILKDHCDTRVDVNAPHQSSGPPIALCLRRGMSNASLPAPIRPSKVEKRIPNRKMRHARDIYILDCNLGKVSSHSGSHELLHMARYQASELQPQRKMRSYSAIKSRESEARRLLRNLKAAEYVLSMMDDGSHFFDAHCRLECDDENADSPSDKAAYMRRHYQRDHIHEVFRRGMEFLCAFCSGPDIENQSVLASHAPLIARYVGIFEIAQQALVSIYSNNLQLCTSVPTEIINVFIGLLLSDSTNPRYIFFLESIVLCNDTPLHDNQLLVLFQLIKAFESGSILLYFDDANLTARLFEVLFTRYAQGLGGQADPGSDELTLNDKGPAIDETNTSAKASSVAEDSRILEYHVRLLHLFAACATGKNTRCQEICQQLVPLDVVLELLLIPGSTDGFKYALLRFFRQVYLTTDDIDLFQEEDIHISMTRLTAVLVSSTQKYIQDIYNEDVNKHATIGLQKSKRMKEYATSTPASAHSPLESASLFLVFYGVIPTFVGFVHQFGHYTEVIAEDGQCGRLTFKEAYDALVALLSSIGAGEWTLPDYVTTAVDELTFMFDKIAEVATSQWGAHTTSLTSLWSDARSRDLRPDLTTLSATMAIPDLVRALARCDSEEASPGSKGADALIATRDQRFQSKSESIVASDDTSPYIEPRVAFIQENPLQSRKLQPIQPAVTGGLCHNTLSGQRCSFSKQAGHESLKPGTGFDEESSSKGSFRLLSTWLRTWLGLHRQHKRGDDNLYSRNSTVVAQSLPLNKMSSGMFKTVQRHLSVKSPSTSSSSRQRFEAFDNLLWRFTNDSHTQSAAREELNSMVDTILSVEATLESEFDVREHSKSIQLSFHQVVAKLVAHAQVLQDSGYHKTNLILLDVFCQMIYACEGNWERRHRMQITLNKLGVTKLIVHLVSTRDDDAIFERCIELGVALLEGMNAEVQESLYKFWIESCDGSAFFARIQNRIQKASRLIHNGFNDRSSVVCGVTSAIHGETGSLPDKHIAKLVKRRSVMFIDTLESSPHPAAAPSISSNQGENTPSSKLFGGSMTSIFRFLQLLCEGHYHQAQRFLITQPNAKEPVNLVEATTSFLLDSYLALTDLDVSLVIQLFETITEFCQGPCIEAQETVANFKFFSAVNAILMQELADENNVAFVRLRRLRASVVITLLSLLEGRNDRTIHVQLVQELNFVALQRNLVDVFRHFMQRYEGKYAGNVKCSDDFYLEMGFNIYFLLQQLADAFSTSSASWIPSDCGGRAWADDGHGRDTSTYFTAFRFFQSHSARVEILWNHQRFKSETDNSSPPAQDDSDEKDGSLIPYYFALHPICFCLTEQSKKKLVWSVSRGNNKLHDFYARSDKLVDEMAHQSRLQRHRGLAVFAGSAELLKRVSFALSVAINLLVLIYYQADGVDSKPYPSSRVTFLSSVDDIVSDPSGAIRVGLSVGGTIQLELCSLILVCYLVNSAPLLIKKGWKRRIQAERERLSKQTASIQGVSTDTNGNERFQDTEQLLRSLRDREEEYDYLLLPRHPLRRSHPRNSTAKTPERENQGKSETAWERLWRFLFGPSSVLLGNLPRTSQLLASTTPSPSEALYTTVTTTQYLKTVAISMGFLLRSPRVLYYIWQISIAILGSYVNNLFFAFHLLDIVNRYQELSNVLRSIVKPAKVLGVTLLLYVVVVYVFAVIGFYFFREDFNPYGALTPSQRAGTQPYQCQRLFQCFLISLDQGLKSDGGLGGFLKYRTIGESSESYARLLFDLLYNTILIIMLLNIVFGVIIDTFASLRTADHEKLMDMQNRCFICSIDAYSFDRATKRGFHDHIYNEHNMWHYLYLFVHIRKKPITEYNGLELYVALKMAKKDVSFFPNHRALCLEKSKREPHLHFVNNVEALRGTGDAAAGVRSEYAASPHVAAGSATKTMEMPRAGLHSESSWNSGKRNSVASPARHRSMASTLPPSSDQTSVEKLDMLESAIQQLLRTQAELKENQVRTMERQSEVMELVLKMRNGLGPVAVPSAPVLRSPPNAEVISSASGCSRRVVLGVVQRSPSGASADHALVQEPRVQLHQTRQSRPPRVFNFDSVSEE